MPRGSIVPSRRLAAAITQTEQKNNNRYRRKTTMHHSFARLRRRNDVRSGALLNGRDPGHGPRRNRLMSIGVVAAAAFLAFVASGLAAALWGTDGALAQDSYPSK